MNVDEKIYGIQTIKKSKVAAIWSFGVGSIPKFNGLLP